MNLWATTAPMLMASKALLGNAANVIYVVVYLVSPLSLMVQVCQRTVSTTYSTVNRMFLLNIVSVWAFYGSNSCTVHLVQTVPDAKQKTYTVVCPLFSGNLGSRP